MAFDTARLLEVGELADLLPVEPNFPTKPPRAERRAFPVVLDEANVMLARADAERFQRLQVEFLRIARIGLEDDLILEVILHPVGVFAVATVIRADARLDVGDAPRLRTKHAQQRRRVVGARADLNVVGLPQHAVLRRPELVQFHDDLLEIERFCHESSFNRGAGNGAYYRSESDDGKPYTRAELRQTSPPDPLSMMRRGE